MILPYLTGYEDNNHLWQRYLCSVKISSVECIRLAFRQEGNKLSGVLQYHPAGIYAGC